MDFFYSIILHSFFEADALFALRSCGEHSSPSSLSLSPLYLSFPWPVSQETRFAQCYIKSRFATLQVERNRTVR